MLTGKLFGRKDRGFSLPEAMVMIMIAGSMMVPILGTMNSGLQRTKAFEIQKAMQNLAESKMNETIQKLVFLGGTASTEDLVATYPNLTDPEFEFRVRTEIKTPFDIEEGGTESPAAPSLKLFSVEVGLRAIVGFQGLDVGVATVSLFTLLDQAPVPPDYMYVADPVNRRVYCVNPDTHLEMESYYLGATYKPYYISVDPSGRFLAIKTQSDLLLMDIRGSSATKGQFGVIRATDCLNVAEESENTNGSNGYRNGRGLVWRPDGKFLYFSFWNSGDTKYNLGVLTVPALPALHTAPPTGDWAMPHSFNLDETVVKDVEMGQDGFLYVLGNADTTNPIKRLNVHTHVMDYPNPQWPTITSPTNYPKARAMATSWDGNEAAFLFPANTGNGLFLGFLLPFSPTHYQDALITHANFNFQSGDGSEDFLISRDNQWLFFPMIHNNSAGRPRIAGVRRSTDGTWASPDFDATLAGNQKIYSQGGSEDFCYLKHSPNGREIIADLPNTNNLRFFNVADLIANPATVVPENYVPTIPGGKISDVDGRLREYVWVAVSDGGTNHKILCMDQGRYNPDIDYKGFWEENRNITALTSSPDHTALTPGGDKLYWAQESDSTIRVKGLYSGANQTIALAGCYPKKAEWTLDKSLIVAVRAPADTSVVNGDITTTGANVLNGIRVYASDGNGNISACNLGYHLPGNTNWEVLDIAPMHKRNGAYVLMVETGTYTKSKIIWIEKSKSRGLSGTEGVLEYKIMAVWDSRFDGFPVGEPQSIALAPDDSLLAVVDPKGNEVKYKIWVYDLVNQHFPNQPGFIFKRYADLPPNPTSTPAGAFDDDSPIDPVRLKECLTSYKPAVLPTLLQEFYSDYPGNLKRNDADCENKSFRLFGHVYYDTTIDNLGYYYGEGFRLGIDGAFPNPTNDPSAQWWREGSWFAFRWTVPWTAPGRKMIQYDTFNDDTDLGLPLGYSTTAIALPTAQALSGSRLYTITGGSNWSIFTNAQTRAFRFSPPLVKELLLNGLGNLPNIEYHVNSNRTKASVAFHRDRGRCYLFIMDDFDKQVFGYGLFGDPHFTPINLDTTFAEIGAATDFGEIQVSADGSRVLIYPNWSIAGGNKYGMILMDVDYDIPFPAAPTFKNPKYLPLETTSYMVKSFAVRPANSFSSRLSTFTSMPNLPVALTGNNVAALADKGIYLVGGSNGEDGTAVNTLRKYDPTDNSFTTLAALPQARKKSGTVLYDGKIFCFGGVNDLLPSKLSTVLTFDFMANSWVFQKNIQENDNTDRDLSAMSACQTPYGLVLAGGEYGQDSVYEILANTTDGFTPIASKMQLNTSAGTTAGDGAAIIGGGELQLATNGDAGGSAVLKDPLTIGPNTHIYSYFQTYHDDDQDGLTFVIHNLANTAVGAKNADLGFKGGTFSGTNKQVCFVMDSKSNDCPGGIEGTIGFCRDGTFSWDTYFQSSPFGNAGHFTQTDLTDDHFWVIYNPKEGTGNTGLFQVFHSKTSDPQTAKRYLTYSYDLDGTLGTSVHIGFTGATNQAGKSMRIRKWHLRVWDEPTLVTTSYANFSSTAGLTLNLTNTVSDVVTALNLTTENSIDQEGSFFLTSSKNIHDQTSFRSQFCYKYSDSDTTNGEGFAFLAQGIANNVSVTSGPKLGYGPCETKAMAVEFDMINQGSDPSPWPGRHICITRGGAGNIFWPTAITFDRNIDYYGWVDYDAVSRNIRVFQSASPSKPTVPVVAGVLNSSLHEITNNAACSDDDVWFGFTAATGGSPSNCWGSFRIKSWDFAIGALGTPNIISNKMKVYYPHLTTGNSSTLPSGLVGRWQFEGNANDSSGNAYHGTLYGGPTYVSGRFGQCLNFDGTDDYVAVSGANLNLNGDNFTLAAWINSNQVDTGFHCFLGADVPSYERYPSMYITNNTEFHCGFGDGTIWKAFGTNSLLTGNSWQHVAFSWDGTTAKLYLNGALKNLAWTTLSGTPFSRTSFNIGRGDNYFKGQIDDVQVYARALDQGEIYTTMNVGMGETIALANLPVAMKDGVLVNHYSRKDRQWDLFYVGGRTTTGNTPSNHLIYKYTFADNSWDTGSLTSLGTGIQKYGVAACSWGDEIFIFGGADNTGTAKTTALAYNPDNGKYRTLTVPVNSVYSAAVPVGPYIYLIGGATNATTGRTNVYRYTP